MKKRLQVLLGPDEYLEIQAMARAARQPVSEWVREALRQARRQQAPALVDRKFAVLAAVGEYSFPAPEIDQMLAEIESGFTVGAQGFDQLPGIERLGRSD